MAGEREPAQSSKSHKTVLTGHRLLQPREWTRPSLFLRQPPAEPSSGTCTAQMSVLTGSINMAQPGTQQHNGGR